jgi:two-component system response regulator RpfG
MDGVEVARELRKIPKTAHIPVVAWTLIAQYPDGEALTKAGLHDCIQKPVSFRELEAVINRFCAEAIGASLR